ncbi:hypothetical protein ACOMHN_024090 [Nucella lapillus]
MEVDEEYLGSGCSTPVQDEEESGQPGSPRRAVNEDDDYVSDGGEVEREVDEQEVADDDDMDGEDVVREEVEREVDEEGGGDYSPHSPLSQGPDNDGDVSMNNDEEAPASPSSIPSPVASPLNSAPPSPGGGSPGWEGHQSPMGSAPASPTASHSPMGSAPGSPASPARSRSASPMGSAPASPMGNAPASPAGSAAPASPQPRSRSGSPAGSAPGSPAGSHRSGSRSPVRSRSASLARSGSRSPVRSRSGSPARSRSGSPARSRSRSPARSKSGSPARSVRSRSGSPAGSRRGSPASDAASSASGGSKAVSRKRRRIIDDDSDKENDDDDKSMHGGSDDEVKDDSDVDIEAVDSERARKGSDDDDSDKESVADELIADIFGSSDEDEDFTGFTADDVRTKKKEKKKTAIKSDDDDEDEDGGGAQGGEGKVLPELSEDENEGAVRREGEGNNDMVSDFEVMMYRKKEESRRNRRKRKDVDMINDNDDLIADMITTMKTAAEEDRNLNQKRQPATRKLKLLPFVQSQLKKSDLHLVFLESGILSALTDWLAPLPDKSLPHLMIRESLLRTLSQFPVISSDSLKSSGIGKAVMYLYKHPREMRENRERAGKLINDWSRPIFSLTSDFKNMSREERQQRDLEQEPKRRRISVEGSQTPRQNIDNAMEGEARALRPGDPGWIYRARVPLPSNRDYVNRPTSSVEAPPSKPSSKKKVGRYEQHVRNFKEKKKYVKGRRAINISIEGRNMAL